MSRKRKSPVGVKIIACLLLLGSLAALALPWMKLAAEVGPNQTRMSPGELIQNFAGLDAAAVLDSVQSELTAAGVQMDVSALSDLLHRVLDGRFLPHEMGIACRDLSVICRAAHRLDLAGTMETLAYGVWGVFGLLALLGLIALICQLTDHRGGIVPYFLLGALVAGGLLYLRQALHCPDNLVQFISVAGMMGSLLAFLCYGWSTRHLKLRGVQLMLHALFVLVPLGLFFCGQNTPARFAVAGALLFVAYYTNATYSCVQAQETLALARPGNAAMATAVVQTYLGFGVGGGRIATAFLLSEGILCTQWTFRSMTITNFQIIFLICSALALFACALLPLLPSLIPQHADYYEP